MSFQQSFSKVIKGSIKNLFKGSQRGRDDKGSATSGERVESEESRLRSESPFVGGGNRDPDGSGSNPVGGRIIGQPWATR